MNNLPIILSIFPFIIFVFLLIVKNNSLLRSSFITLVLYTFLAVFYWQIDPNFLYVSYGKGLFVALDIFIIIFGAIFFLEILKDIKIIKNISYYLANFSKDYRVQIIVIAWMFEAFLEGTAGFGTPAAVAVPLLIGIGLSPIKSLIIGLIGNSTAGVFGAAGTPIKIGFAGLENSLIPLTASMLNLVGIIVPVFILWIITRERVNKNQEFLNALPFAIWSGIAITGSSILFAKLGPEFPSILGSVLGIILIFITTKLNILTPKESLSLTDEKELEKTMSPQKAFMPYIILIVLLILGKFIIGKFSIPIGIGFIHNFNLFNPGFMFLIAGLIVAIIWKTNKFIIKDSIKMGIKESYAPFLVIISMLAIVQIMINSGQNISGFSSAISIISDFFKTSMLPFFAPFLGAFGAFVTGSVTVSNILFGHLFTNASIALNINQTIILSLGVAGAAAGNMMALADILTAEAVAGVKNKEKEILKGVFIPCLIYLSILGIIGLLII